VGAWAAVAARTAVYAARFLDLAVGGEEEGARFNEDAKVAARSRIADVLPSRMADC